jgi:hypothetical protein
MCITCNVSTVAQKKIKESNRYATKAPSLRSPISLKKKKRAVRKKTSPVTIIEI